MSRDKVVEAEQRIAAVRQDARQMVEATFKVARNRNHFAHMTTVARESVNSYAALLQQQLLRYRDIRDESLTQVSRIRTLAKQSPTEHLDLQERSAEWNISEAYKDDPNNEDELFLNRLRQYYRERPNDEW